MLGIVFMICIFFMPTINAKTYKLLHMSHIAWSTAQVADVKGFWKKQGLDIEVVIYLTTKDIINAVKYKRGDFYLGNLPTILKPLNNKSVFLGSAMMWGGGYIMVIKKELLHQNMTGMNVGVVGGDSPGEIVLSNYLKKSGHTVSDVKIVPLNNDDLVKNFVYGRLKAVVLQDRSEQQLLKAGGVTVERTPTIPLGVGSYQDILKTVPKADIKKFYRGWIEAKLWTENPTHQEEHYQIIRKFTLKGKINVSDDEIQKELLALKHFDAKELLKNNQELHENQWEGNIFDHLSPKEFFQNKEAMEVLQEYIFP